MDTSKFFEILIYTIPTIITGAIALYFFKLHTSNEENRRNFLLRKEKQNIALPLQLQAYERLALFLERISPAKLLIRVKPTGNEPIKYQNKLIQNIEQEFEHNLAQQIYVTDACWNAVVTSKNSMIQMIRTAAANKDVDTNDLLREQLIQNTMNTESPTTTALAFLKNEVKKLF